MCVRAVRAVCAVCNTTASLRSRGGGFLPFFPGRVLTHRRAILVTPHAAGNAANLAIVGAGIDSSSLWFTPG